jgi:Fe-S cluster biogenesis protein NfuA
MKMHSNDTGACQSCSVSSCGLVIQFESFVVVHVDGVRLRL